MIVKICGVTRPDDAAHAVRAGADWLGLNFWPKSKRHLDLDQAHAVARAARRAAEEHPDAPRVTLVGVFVNQPVADIVRAATRASLDLIQLHGDDHLENAAELTARGLSVLRAVAMAGEADLDRLDRCPGDVVLIDTPTVGYGGSGRTFDWKLARRAVATGRKIILAGGLTPDNVARAVAEVAPHGVDVASGVESSPGVKDPALVTDFVARAKGASAG